MLAVDSARLGNQDQRGFMTDKNENSGMPPKPRLAIALPDKECFRADEVMILFGFKTVKTVYRWIRTGKLKYIVTPGGRKRISRAEILRFAQEVQNDPGMPGR